MASDLASLQRSSGAWCYECSSLPCRSHFSILCPFKGMIKDARKGVSNCIKSWKGWFTNEQMMVIDNHENRTELCFTSWDQSAATCWTTFRYLWYLILVYCNTMSSPSCYFVHYHLLLLFEFYPANHAGTHPIFVKCLSPQNWLKGNNTAEKYHVLFLGW